MPGMKIQLLSDLHLEANPGFQPEPAEGADLLVLAGDIGSYQRRYDGSVMTEPDWGLRRFSPLAGHAGWPIFRCSRRSTNLASVRTELQAPASAQ